MGSTRTPRKATFTVETVKGVKRFTAVNKRAHAVVRKAGKRLHITADELQAFVGKGSYTFHVYDAKGNLKAIKF